MVHALWCSTTLMVHAFWCSTTLMIHALWSSTTFMIHALWCFITFMVHAIWCSTTSMVHALWCSTTVMIHVLWCSTTFKVHTFWCSTTFMVHALWCSTTVMIHVLWCSTTFKVHTFWCSTTFMVHALMCSTTFSSCSLAIFEHPVSGTMDSTRWNNMARPLTWLKSLTFLSLVTSAVYCLCYKSPRHPALATANMEWISDNYCDTWNFPASQAITVQMCNVLRLSPRWTLTVFINRQEAATQKRSSADLCSENLNFDDETDSLSRNVGNKLPFYAA